MEGILSSGWALILAIYPIVAVSATEFINFIKNKLSDSGMPGYVRIILTFGIASLLKFLPEAGEIDPATVGQALTAFVGAVLAAIKARDVIKTQATGKPVGG